MSIATETLAAFRDECEQGQHDSLPIRYTGCGFATMGELMKFLRIARDTNQNYDLVWKRYTDATTIIHTAEVTIAMASGEPYNLAAFRDYCNRD